MQLHICSVFSTYVSLDGDGCSLTPLGLQLQLPCVLELSELQKGDEVSDLRKRDTTKRFIEARVRPSVSPYGPSSSSAALWRLCAS